MISVLLRRVGTQLAADTVAPSGRCPVASIFSYVAMIAGYEIFAIAAVVIAVPAAPEWHSAFPAHRERGTVVA